MAASAVSLEKDRRTFILLLITDLRSYEIVLGKLFGSLLQIGLLLAGVVYDFGGNGSGLTVQLRVGDVGFLSFSVDQEGTCRPFGLLSRPPTEEFDQG